MDFIKCTEVFTANEIYVRISAIRAIIHFEEECYTKIYLGEPYTMDVVETPDKVFELIQEQRAKDSPWTSMELPFQ